MTINYATNASGAPATNRISTAVNGSTTYTHTYDAAGNLTNDGQQAYTYDGANRLKEVGTGGQNTYGYDGDGMRVRKTESGATLFYVRSAVLKNVAMEVNSTGMLRAYVYSGGSQVAQLASDGNFYWIHKDHLGSGRRLTDSTGTMKFRSEYSAYGQVILDWSASGAANPNTRKFTGYERDAATGLDYANARMYGSNYGRFMTPDPIGLKSADLNLPQSLNRYSYVWNDPVNHSDPSGLLTIIIGGSFNRGADWGQPGKEMWEAIRATFGEDPIIFEWNALLVFPPLYTDIEFWGAELARYINTYEFKEGEKLNIVAHSHGGNVVKVATNLLGNGIPTIKKKIDNLVTLGTPQNFDLQSISPFAVKNYCNVSSLADPVQFGGSSPLQIYYTTRYFGLGSFHASWGAHELFRGNWSEAARHSALSIYNFALSAAWLLSTRIDPFAKNVLLGSETHSELHTVPVWNKIKGSCGL